MNFCAINSYLNGEKKLKNLVKCFYISFCLIMTLCVGACAVPGFGPLKVEASRDNSIAPKHILGYAPVIENPPITEGMDANESLPVALKPITSGLVQSQSLLRPTTIPSDIRSLMGKAPAYTIGPGDVVGVIVYDHPELLPNSGAVISQSTDPTGVSVASGFIVGSTGFISFPYTGRLKMEGLTEIEASDLVAKSISRYIRDPQVTVRIQSFRSRRAYVEGEVRSPGVQIFTDVPMTLAEAINRAGGITADGDRSFVTLSRKDKTYRINLPLLQKLGADSTSIILESGDVVAVKSRNDSKVYVLGEALRPSALTMRDGLLTLNDALGEAGGPSLTTADTSQIYVIRDEPDGKSAVYHLNAKNPAALALSSKFELMPRDVVYIDPVPLVQWNRVISLILPSAQILNQGSQAVTR